MSDEIDILIEFNNFYYKKVLPSCFDRIKQYEKNKDLMKYYLEENQIILYLKFLDQLTNGLIKDLKENLKNVHL